MQKFGIDLSRHNEGINFDTLKNEGVEFAILRAAGDRFVRSSAALVCVIQILQSKKRSFFQERLSKCRN